MLKPVLLFAGVLISGNLMAAEIPLKNAGFEQPMVGTRVPGWIRIQHAGTSAYVVSNDSKDFADGERSISMRRTTQQVYGQILQRVESRELAGKPVELKAMMKTADVGKLGWVMVLTFKNYDNILDQVRAAPVIGNTAWTDVALTKVAPPNTNTIEVGFLLLDGGTGWVDRVRLRTLDGDEKDVADNAASRSGIPTRGAASKSPGPDGDVHPR